MELDVPELAAGMRHPGPRRSLTLRTALWLDVWAADVCGHPLLDPDVLQRFTDAAYRRLRLSRRLVMSSIASFAQSSPLTISRVREICFRLAGARDWLAVHEIPLTSDPQAPNTDIETMNEGPCSAAITDWSRGMIQDRPVVYLHFKVLTDRCTGAVFARPFSPAFLWVLSKQLAWSYRRPWSGDPGQMTLMWLALKLRCSRWGWGTFNHYNVPGPHRSHNQRLLKHRQAPCHKGFRWACHHCPIGHDGCPRGTHPVTFQIRVCKLGDEPQRLRDNRHPHTGYFEPYARSDICMQCRHEHGIRDERGFLDFMEKQGVANPPEQDEGQSRAGPVVQPSS